MTSEFWSNSATKAHLAAGRQSTNFSKTSIFTNSSHIIPTFDLNTCINTDNYYTYNLIQGNDLLSTRFCSFVQACNSSSKIMDGIFNTTIFIHQQIKNHDKRRKFNVWFIEAGYVLPIKRHFEKFIKKGDGDDSFNCSISATGPALSAIDKSHDNGIEGKQWEWYDVAKENVTEHHYEWNYFDYTAPTYRLGPHPYQCLSNITMCDKGFTLHFWIWPRHGKTDKNKTWNL